MILEKRNFTGSLELNIGSSARLYNRLIDKGIKYKRSSIEVKATGAGLKVSVKASDPTALVASLSSVLKQLTIISNADSAIENFHYNDKNINVHKDNNYTFHIS